MMFWIKFAGLIACLGILAFGGYKTVDGIELDKMMDEIAEVVDDTPLIPSLDILGDDDSESSDEKHPVNPPSDGNADGGEQGDESNSAPTPNPEPDSPASGSLSTDKAVDAFAGLYDNHDPDFNEVNKEFFVGMVEGVLLGNSNSSEPPEESDPDFDSSFDADFDGSVDPDAPFVPDEDPDEDDDDEMNSIIIDVAGNYYENLQQSIQNNIESNRDASAEEQQAARDEFIQQEAEAFAGLLNIATKPEETTGDQIVQSVDAVIKSDVCLDTVSQTVSSNDSITDTVKDATRDMDQSYKADIENKLNAALAENPERAQQYNDLAALFGITLGGN